MTRPMDQEESSPASRLGDLDFSVRPERWASWQFVAIYASMVAGSVVFFVVGRPWASWQVLEFILVWIILALMVVGPVIDVSFSAHDTPKRRPNPTVMTPPPLVGEHMLVSSYPRLPRLDFAALLFLCALLSLPRAVAFAVHQRQEIDRSLPLDEQRRQKRRTMTVLLVVGGIAALVFLVAFILNTAYTFVERHDMTTVLGVGAALLFLAVCAAIALISWLINKGEVVLQAFWSHKKTLDYYGYEVQKSATQFVGPVRAQHVEGPTAQLPLKQEETKQVEIQANRDIQVALAKAQTDAAALLNSHQHEYILQSDRLAASTRDLALKLEANPKETRSSKAQDMMEAVLEAEKFRERAERRFRAGEINEDQYERELKIWAAMADAATK